MSPAPADRQTSEEIRSAAQALNINLSASQSQLLVRYCTLLWAWNTKINLTRHTDVAKFVKRDLLDTWSFARVIQPDEVVLDVGTGGGVPGVPLAVLRPDLNVFLCETVAKKARAVHDIVSQLGLPIPVLHGRVEEFLTQGRWEFHSLLFRAVAPLSKILRWVRPHWDRFDRLLILKGPRWVEERGEARHFGHLQGLALRIVDQYSMPDTQAESYLLQVTPKSRCSDGKTCLLSHRACPAPSSPILVEPMDAAPQRSDTRSDGASQGTDTRSDAASKGEASPQPRPLAGRGPRRPRTIPRRKRPKQG